LCAAMCARRATGNNELVPRLQRALATQIHDLDDEVAFGRASRRFHDAIVAECGNKTMVLVIGALQSMWDVHAESVLESDPNPRRAAATRGCSVGAHRRLIGAVAAGNAKAAAWLAERHFDATQMFRRSGDKDILVASRLLEARRFSDG
jgi:GntR family transcriptional repressor for pyruvate dehydrogenase complex